MGRFSGGLLTTAGSVTNPIVSLYAVAGSGGRLMEVHLFNTTTTAVQLRLMRITTAGTKPAATADGEYDENSPPALMQFHGTHTSTGPTLGTEIKRVELGATIGSGIIWTFGAYGLVIPLGVGNAIGVVPVGTGQACSANFVWEE